METAIQQLFTKNETILAECEKLKQANERLQAENAELQQRLQVSALINIIRIVSLFYIWFGNITMRLMTVTVAQKYRVRFRLGIVDVVLDALIGFLSKERKILFLF